MQSNLKRFAFVLPLVCLLAACGKGLDKKLDTTGNDDAFNTSFWAANKDMTQADKDAWSWAVQDLSINNIRSKYPDSTLRQVIRGEAQSVLTEAVPRIAELEASKKSYDDTLKDLNNITTSNVILSDKDWQKPLGFDIHNGSHLPVGKLAWNAWLYINGEDKPVASAYLDDHFRQGLPAGANAHHDYSYADTLSSAWFSPAVVNAKSREIVVEVDPDSVENFKEERYMRGAPYTELKNLRESVVDAKKYVNY